MSDENDDGSQNEENDQQPMSIVSNSINPYSILKVDRDASEEAIQRSYKLLSRTFHPDKQPPGQAREAAQEVFVSFKNAHDILIDPVQRQAYDEHGSFGVNVVKKSIHVQEKDPGSLYSTLLKLHQSGKQEEARLVLKEALQQLDFDSKNREVRFSSTLEFPCTTVATTFLGEGSETMTVPELERAHMSFSVSSAPPTPDNKWSVTVGGNSNVQNGKGDASGNISVEYQPVQATNVNCELDLSNPFKVSFGSTRKFSSRTVVTTKVTTIPKSNTLSMSLISQRALFENNLLGTLAMGMGTDFAIHYYLLSCTTLWSEWPQMTAKVNIGVDAHPIKLSAKHQFGDGRNAHDGVVSYAWGPSGIEFKAIAERALSSYATCSIGLQHTTKKGLTWLLALKRGDITFRVPIHVSTIASPGYASKFIFLGFLSGLIDNAVKEALEGTTSKIVDQEEKKAVERESSFMALDKSKADAEQQKELMMKTAENFQKLEKAKNGLVIRQASYWVEGGDYMDATIQMQFWVRDSRLTLPPTPKSHLLGFYSIVPVASDRSTNWWSSWWKARKDPLRKQQPVPKLTVRYESNGGVYETTVSDNEELILPQPGALLLGRSDAVV